MSVKMGTLLPHPPIIIPEIGGRRQKEVNKTIKAIREVSREIKSLQADLLISISPHAPVFTDGIGIFDYSTIKGDFGDFGHPDFELEVDGDLEFAKRLGEETEKEGFNLVHLSEKKVNLLKGKYKLDHGVLVPLYFLKEVEIELPLVALSMALMEYEELYEFGKIIARTAENNNKDIVIIASGDLSHRLKPGAPAGYNPRGEEFDQRLISSLNDCDVESLLNIDPVLVEKAGECGLRPLIIMLGALSDYQINCEVKSYEGPFGVGYGVATVYPEN